MPVSPGRIVAGVVSLSSAATRGIDTEKGTGSHHALRDMCRILPLCGQGHQHACTWFWFFLMRQYASTGLQDSSSKCA